MGTKEREAQTKRLIMTLVTELVQAEAHAARGVIIAHALAAEHGVRVPTAEEFE